MSGFDASETEFVDESFSEAKKEAADHQAKLPVTFY